MQGYGALATSAASDAVAATAQRIQGLKQAGLLQEGQGPSNGPVASSMEGSRPLARPSSEACLAAAASSAAGGMPSSRSCDDLAAATSDGTHVRLGCPAQLGRCQAQLWPAYVPAWRLLLHCSWHVIWLWTSSLPPRMRLCSLVTCSPLPSHRCMS